jgi:hypothetical protein
VASASATSRPSDECDSAASARRRLAARTAPALPARARTSRSGRRIPIAEPCLTPSNRLAEGVRNRFARPTPLYKRLQRNPIGVRGTQLFAAWVEFGVLRSHVANCTMIALRPSSHERADA